MFILIKVHSSSKGPNQNLMIDELKLNRYINIEELCVCVCECVFGIGRF